MFSIQNGERDFKYLAEVTQAVHDLHVPPTALQHTAPLNMCSKLPEVVQLTHQHGPDEEPAATIADPNIAVLQRTQLRIQMKTMTIYSYQLWQ